jgi:hypothetical protein
MIYCINAPMKTLNSILALALMFLSAHSYAEPTSVSRCQKYRGTVVARDRGNQVDSFSDLIGTAVYLKDALGTEHLLIKSDVSNGNTDVMIGRAIDYCIDGDHKPGDTVEVAAFPAQDWKDALDMNCDSPIYAPNYGPDFGPPLILY